jgi:hypothetical protein
MFLITNRRIDESKRGVNKLLKVPNERGPNELRVVEATKSRGKWKIDVLPDILNKGTDDKELNKINDLRKSLNLPPSDQATGSDIMFLGLLPIVNPRRADPNSRRKGKDVLLFVHGFNNTPEEILDRCDGLAKTYGVEVIAFSWPSNGGGVKGVASYLDDKRDAQASVGAFDRVIAKARDMIDLARNIFMAEFERELDNNVALSGEERRERRALEVEKHCPFRVSMMLHSMGNYLLERTLKSTALHGNLLVFDNILMAAADVNSPGHASWLEQIQIRNRLYVTINEDDNALRASRLKGGDEQLARLGHSRRNLDASNATYVDFTDASYVASSHSYFEDKPIQNRNVKSFFKLAVHGKRAEHLLKFDPVMNTHRIR